MSLPREPGSEVGAVPRRTLEEKFSHGCGGRDLRARMIEYLYSTP